MDEIAWKKDDLAYWQGRLYVVTDAGYGRPRGNMVLTRPHARITTDEERITRPEIVAGTWVRIDSVHGVRYRVALVRNDGRLSLAASYEGRQLTNCSATVSAVRCVRVEPPYGRPDDTHRHSTPAKSKIVWIQKDREIFGRTGSTLLRIVEGPDSWYNQHGPRWAWIETMTGSGWQAITKVKTREGSNGDKRRLNEDWRDQLMAFAEALYSYEPGELS